MRLLNASDIHALIDFPTAIRVMRRAYQQFEPARFSCPDRSIICTGADPAQPDGYFGAIPALDHSQQQYMVKIAGLVMQQPQCQMAALIALMDSRTARLQALLDGESLTNLRTAATTALVTDLLATRQASTLALLGTGRLASALLHAHRSIRPLRQIRVYGRDAAKLTAFINKHRDHFGPQVEFVAAGSVRDAITQSDIIVSATSTTYPLIESADLPERCHIATVGNHSPDFCELSAGALAQLSLVTDNQAAAAHEAPALLQQALELHTLLQQPAALTQLQQQPQTAYISLGSAFQDLSLASAIWQAAQDHNDGLHWQPEL